MHGREGDLHGAEDVRGFERAGGARGPGGGADSEGVELVEDGFAFDEVARQGKGVGRAGLGGAVDFEVGDGGEQAGLEVVAEGGEARHVGKVLLREVAGGGQGGGVGEVFGAGAAPGLLVAAEQEGADWGAFADVEGPDALGGVHLVAGEGEQVHVRELAGEVEGELSGDLGGVGVEEDGRGGLLDNAGEVGDGEDDAGLVVGEHDGDEEGFVGADGADEGRDVEGAGGEDRDVGDGIAAAFELAAGLEDGGVFDGRGDDVAARGIGGGGPEEDGVVGLGGAGGEEDFGGVGGVEEAGDGGAEGGEMAGGLGGRGVHAGGVVEAFAEEGGGGGGDLGGDGGGGVVVCVDDGHGGGRDGGLGIRRR